MKHARKTATRATPRSLLYGALAKSFDYPTRGSVQEIADRLAEALKGNWTASVRSAIECLRASLARLDDEDLEREYLQIFTHVCAADCNPCESSYLCRHLFQVSQRMSDLAGFYRAFGVEPSGERHDHVGVELEFMSYLAFREANELACEKPARARDLRRAQRLFLERHLGKWLMTFCMMLERKAVLAQSSVRLEETEAKHFAILARTTSKFIVEDGRRLRAIVAQPVAIAPLTVIADAEPLPTTPSINGSSVFGVAPTP